MNICLLTNFNKINEGYADLGCFNKLKYGPRTYEGMASVKNVIFKQLSLSFKLIFKSF